MNPKKLNLFLLVCLFFLTSLTLRKWYFTSKISESDTAVPTAAEAQLIYETIPSDQNQYLDNDRLTRGAINEAVGDPVEIQYEKLRYDRAIEAIRTGHSADLKRVFLEGIDFEKLPSGSLERLKEIAQEEKMQAALNELLPVNKSKPDLE